MLLAFACCHQLLDFSCSCVLLRVLPLLAAATACLCLLPLLAAFACCRCLLLPFLAASACCLGLLLLLVAFACCLCFAFCLACVCVFFYLFGTSFAISPVCSLAALARLALLRFATSLLLLSCALLSCIHFACFLSFAQRPLPPPLLLCPGVAFVMMLEHALSCLNAA